MRFIITLSLLFASSANSWSQSPNILLIIADDLGVDYFNGYQNSNLLPTTPTMDSIRNAGITFTNVWSTPKCTPTRATIMSGKHGVKTGVLGSPGHLDLTHRSIFKAISDSTNGAYADAVIGKWHISQPPDPYHPLAHDADYYTGLLSSGVTDYYAWEHTYDGATNINNDYATSVLTDSSIQWVNAQTQPWFLWFAHVAPHAPYHEPPAGTYSIQNTSNNARKFVAMVECMDYEINRLLNNIPANELSNTLIIILGDNGTSNVILQNYPANHGKSTLYQGGIHVPMIISGAGVTRVGEQEDAMVQLTDIYATILEATGSTLPGGINNSLSFNHLLDNSSGSTRDYNYSEVIQDTVDAYTIRNDRYKLIHSNVDNSEEFYDLLVDELETNNLLQVGLTASEQTALDDLVIEANQRRQFWSCRDHIQNGDETGIDCGGTFCSPCAVSVDNIEANEKDISIFPNPAQNQLTVLCNKLHEQIDISSITGQSVLSYSDLEMDNQLDISHLARGLYFVKVYNQKNQLIFERKLIKE